MKNAHLRFGQLQYHKVTRDTTIDVRLWLDRLIADCGQDNCGTSKGHLISVFGGEQEVAAIAGAIVEQGIFQVRGPGIAALRISLGEDAEVFRGSISVPGRKRPVRHLVAVSKELALTWRGSDLKARQTVVCSDDPQFVLYRIGVRFGLPVLPEWSEWFWRELETRNAVRRLVGLGCRPLVLSGTKKRFLGWIGHALKRGRIHIPEGTGRPNWNFACQFDPAAAIGSDEAPA